MTNACSNSDKSAGSSNNGEILELRVEEVSATRAVVRFITSEPNTCEAEYGTSRDGLTLSATDPTMSAAVSSNFGGAANHEVWGANNAFDGFMNTARATNGDGDDASVILDFGVQRTIAGFGFGSR